MEIGLGASSKRKDKTALFMLPKAKKAVKKSHRKKPKWEPNYDTSFLDSSDSEEVNDLEGFGMKRKSSHCIDKKVKIAKDHGEDTKLAMSQTTKQPKLTEPISAGGHATSDRKSQSSHKKYISKKNSASEQLSNTASWTSNSIKKNNYAAVGTDEIQCLGVFSPGEFKSPVAKKKNSLSIHDKSYNTLPRKLDQGSADFQSPATYGSKLKNTHIVSDIGE